MHSDRSQISNMVRFARNSRKWLIIFTESPILDVWLGYE